MKKWLKLFFCSVLIWGFIYFIPRALNKIPSYEKIIDNAELMEIDNAALFYSEENLISEAEKELNKRLSSTGK